MLICNVVNVFRVAPALIVPVFKDGEHFYVQSIKQDKIAEFVQIELNCFDKCSVYSVDQPTEYYIGDSAVYVLAFLDGKYYIGDSRTIISIYKTNQYQVFDSSQTGWAINSGFDAAMLSFEREIVQEPTSMQPASFYDQINQKLFSNEWKNKKNHGFKRSHLVCAKWNSFQIPISVTHYEQGIACNFKYDKLIKTYNDVTFYSPFDYLETDNIYEFYRYYLSASSYQGYQDWNNDNWRYPLSIIYRNRIPHNLPIHNLLKLIEALISPSCTQENKQSPVIKVWSRYTFTKLLTSNISRSYESKLLFWKQELRKKRWQDYNMGYSFSELRKKIDCCQILIKNAEKKAKSEIPRVFELLQIDLKPPVMISPNDNYEEARESYWHKVLDELQPLSEEDQKYFFWVNVQKLYDNVYLFCAKNIYSNKLFFSLIEGNIKATDLSNFIEELAVKLGREDILTLLLLSSSYQCVKLTDDFWLWQESHQDQYNIIIERSDLPIYIGGT